MWKDESRTESKCPGQTRTGRRAAVQAAVSVAVLWCGEVRLVLQCSVGCVAPCQALMVNGGGNLGFGFVTVFVMTNLIACID